MIADVEGDIEDVDGVLKITKIRMRYRFKIPAGKRESIERVLQSYAEKCPAYQSVRDSIQCTWEVDITEE